MRLFRIVLAACILAVVSVAPATAPAAPPATAPATVTVEQLEQLERLKATLEDEGKRTALIADIDALIALGQQQAGQAEESGGRLGREMVTALAEAQESLDAVRSAYSAMRADAAHLLAWAKQIWRDPQRRAEIGREVVPVAGIIAAGWLAEYGLWMLLSPVRRRLMTRAPTTRSGRFRYGLQGAGVELLPILGFFAAVAAVGLISGSATRLTAAVLVLALVYGSIRGLLTFARLLLAPRAAGLRLLPLTSPTAADLYGWLRRLLLILAIAILIVLWSRIAGLPAAAERLITAIAVVCGAAVLAAFVLVQRSRWNAWLLARLQAAVAGTALSLPLRALVHAGPIFVLALLIGLTVAILLRSEDAAAFLLRGLVGMLATLALGGVAIAVLDRALARAAAVAAGSEASPPWRLVAPCLPAAHGLGRALVLAAVLFGLLQSWGAGVFGWVASPSGQRWLGSVASIILILAIAALLWQLLSRAIAHQLQRLEAGGDVAPRLRTLLPLLRRIAFIVLAFIVTMIVLSEIGVAVAPLLAGAGIVGLAIGFGAQKLVQDVITGIFILLENAVAIGDVVTVAGIGGLVEDLSIRSIRLRDLSGNVHTIPFSSVDTVTNMTRGFSYYLLDIAVAYREDTDEVAEVCCRIVDEMRADPAFAPFILEPLEVLGVDQFADSAVIIKARIKTPPIKQWLVGREFNRRMKKRFDELGIEIPFPHRTIYFGVDKAGQAPTASVRLDRGGDGPDVAPDPPPAPSAAAPLNRSVAAHPDAEGKR